MFSIKIKQWYVAAGKTDYIEHRVHFDLRFSFRIWKCKANNSD